MSKSARERGLKGTTVGKHGPVRIIIANGIFSAQAKGSPVNSAATDRPGVRFNCSERGDVNSSSLRENKPVNNGERAGEASL